MNKNETVNLLDLDIQLFADTADNNSGIEQPVNTDNAGSDETLPFVDGVQGAENTPTEQNDKKISTKAFSDRLKREKQALLAQKEVEKVQELDRIAISKGYKNWKDLEQSGQKEKLEKIGIEDADTFNSIINDAVSNNPIVLEAKRVIEINKQKEQEQTLNSAIQEITMIDPDIKSVNDLIALDNYDELYSLIEKGYSLPDAYKLTFFEKLAAKKAASAAQNVITNIDSKNHLKTVKGAPTKDVVVPEDVLASYKKNNPKMTDEQIRKHYATFLGGER